MTVKAVEVLGLPARLFRMIVEVVKAAVTYVGEVFVSLTARSDDTDAAYEDLRRLRSGR